MCKWVLVCVFVAAPALAQPVPDRVQIIVETLHARHPQLALGGDDDRRQLTRTIIEQVVWEFPADGWGWKSADPTRPPSKDALARRTPDLIGCDWQHGETRQPNRPVTCHPIPGQVFIPVAGINHLGSSPPTPPPPIPPIPPAVDDVLALLRQTRGEDGAQQERIYADLKASIADSTHQLITEVRASHAVLSEQLRRHDEEPAWVVKVLSNRYVQAALVGLGTWLTSWQVSK